MNLHNRHNDVAPLSITFPHLAQLWDSRRFVNRGNKGIFISRAVFSMMDRAHA